MPLARVRRLRFARRGLAAQLATVTTGTAVQRLLGGVMLILLARWLTAADYGRFSLAYVAMATTSQVAAGFGGGFVALYRRRPDDREALVSAHRLTALALAAAAVLLGAAVSPLLARFAFDDPGLTPALILGFAGAATLTLFSNLNFEHQAQMNFGRFALLLALSGFLNLTAVALVKLAVPDASPVAYLAALCASSLIVAVACLATLGLRALRRSSMVRTYLHYGKWPALSASAYAVSQGMDLFILAAFVEKSEVGHYSAAVRYAALYGLFVAGLASLLLPTAASAQDWPSRRQYLETSVRLAAILACVNLVLLALAQTLVPLLFGAEYEESIGLARLLVVAILPVAVSVALGNLFYSADRLQWIAAVTGVQIAALAVLCLSLIPVLGATGAAIAVLVSRLLAIATTLVGLRAIWGRGWLRRIRRPS